MNNLRLSDIIVYSEEDPEVNKYIHGRQSELIIVKLSEKQKNIIKIYDLCFYQSLKRLKDNNLIFSNNLSKLNKMVILQSLQKFRSTGQSQVQSSLFYSLLGDFGVIQTALHGRSLLNGYGITQFYDYMIKTFTPSASNKLSRSKQAIMKSGHYHNMLRLCEEVIKENNGYHNKTKTVEKLLYDHFNNHNDARSSRAIVFSSYRNSVNELVEFLSKHQPLIKPTVFIGQNKGKKNIINNNKVKGQTQKEQKRVIKAFTEGVYNVIVATCIGEEGLDIGEVDLIINFDASASPIRAIQRKGRTGRKRIGRSVTIVTEGAELNAYKSGKARFRRLLKDIKQADHALPKYKPIIRMIPKQIIPNVIEKSTAGNQLTNMIINSPMKKVSKKIVDDGLLTIKQQQYYNDKIALTTSLSQLSALDNKLYLNAYATKICQIKHSNKTKFYINFFKYINDANKKPIYKLDIDTDYRLDSDELQEIILPNMRHKSMIIKKRKKIIKQQLQQDEQNHYDDQYKIKKKSKKIISHPAVSNKQHALSFSTITTSSSSSSTDRLLNKTNKRYHDQISSISTTNDYQFNNLKKKIKKRKKKSKKSKFSFIEAEADDIDDLDDDDDDDYEAMNDDDSYDSDFVTDEIIYASDNDSSNNHQLHNTQEFHVQQMQNASPSVSQFIKGFKTFQNSDDEQVQQQQQQQQEEEEEEEVVVVEEEEEEEKKKKEMIMMMNMIVILKRY